MPLTILRASFAFVVKITHTVAVVTMPTSSSEPPSTSLKTPLKVSAKELFWTFTWLSLCGFGGVLPWVHRAIVEKKKWLTPREFTELMGLGQILPGANVTNLVVMLGYRLGGLRGAGASVAGLLTAPFLIILGLGYLYQKYSSLLWIQGALKGVTAVVSGLVLATCFKLAKGQTLPVRAVILGLMAAVAVGVLHWPLLAVIVVLIPLALALEWKAAS